MLSISLYSAETPSIDMQSIDGQTLEALADKIAGMLAEIKLYADQLSTDPATLDHAEAADLENLRAETQKCIELLEKTQADTNPLLQPFIQERVAKLTLQEEVATLSNENQQLRQQVGQLQQQAAPSPIVTKRQQSRRQQILKIGAISTASIAVFKIAEYLYKKARATRSS